MSPRKIIIISPEFNYCCGRSKHVFLLIRYLERAGFNIIFISNKGDSFERLKTLNVKIIIIKDLFSKNIFKIWGNIQELRKIVNYFNADIIHSHHRLSDALVYYALIGQSKKILTVNTEHSILRKKIFFNYFSKEIIAVSVAVKKIISNNYKIKENRINLIYNFVSTSDYDLKSTPEQKKYVNIVSAGRFAKEKNYSLLLNAAKLLIKNNNITITLIGDGEEKYRLNKLANKLKIRLNLINIIPDVSEYINNADICVLTSKSEALPTFMLEAGLFKKPFIGPDIGGVGEFIINGNNGLLFKAGDSLDLSIQIKKYIEDVNLAKQCSENLHTTVMTKYSEESILPKILNIYEKVYKH